jgi:hypothetical protein
VKRGHKSEKHLLEHTMSEFQPLKQLEQLLGAAASDRPVLFPPNSRYRDTETTVLVDDDGRAIVYLRRRFVPQPERFATVKYHTFREKEDRLDRLAYDYWGDPELYWQMCDANRALQPEELETTGKRLRVTHAEGMMAPGTEA